MLSFQEFFVACAGFWTTERTYHSTLNGEVERSYTEYQVDPLTAPEKQGILTAVQSQVNGGITIDPACLSGTAETPGFAIAFNTRSEKGETVSMSLKALFVPDAYILGHEPSEVSPIPIAAQVPVVPSEEGIAGFYLRDEGYSESGAIAGRFTYQPTRQTLEMTTYYRRSVAVDQMRILAADLRVRTIVTYQRPAAGELPTVIDLVGFGVERKQINP